MKYRQFLALMLVISIASCSAHTYNRTAYAMTETETNGSAAEVIVDDSSDKEISGVDVEYDGKDNYKVKLSQIFELYSRLRYLSPL